MKNARIFIGFILFFLVSSAFATEQLIIEPDDGRAPILSAIQNAKSSIDLVMYGLTDARMINALIQAKKSGKNIQIVLEPHPYKADNENEFAIHRLQTANITAQIPNPQFHLTHQKTFIIDQSQAIVMTFNLTHSSFKNERNFALVIDDPKEIQEISQVMTADAQHKTTSVNHPNLIWSPNNSREKIIDFIKNAKSDIKIYAQDLTDYATIGELAKAARSGKKVEIITSTPAKSGSKKYDYLKKAGVIIHLNKNYIIHAKIIIVDQERAILGSINLTKSSFHDNRELSIITHDKNIVNKLIKTFDSDI